MFEVEVVLGVAPAGDGRFPDGALNGERFAACIAHLIHAAAGIQGLRQGRGGEGHRGHHRGGSRQQMRRAGKQQGAKTGGNARHHKARWLECRPEYTAPAMQLPLPLRIGLRYTRAKRRNHFISFISATSMGGIALGVTALITVISVMNGFEAELRSRILSMTAHLQIQPWEGPLSNWQDLAATVAEQPEVTAVRPFVAGEGMVRAGGSLSGVILRGIDPASEATTGGLAEHVISGDLADLEPGRFDVIIGRHLAASLGVLPGDDIDLMIPQANVGPLGVTPRFRRCRIAGLFEVGMYEFDRSLVLMHREDAARLYRLGDAVHGLSISIVEPMRAPWVARDVRNQLPMPYSVDDWSRQHRNFFAAIQTEKRVMFIILSLIIAVAAFNIVSTLVMVVQDKQADIAILRTLGATRSQILGVFVVQGSVIGVIGTALGLVGGVLLALNIETIVPAIEQMLGRDLLADDVYYISDLPSRLHLNDVVQIGLVSLALGLLSTLYPAWRASKVEPAEALRYE